MGDVAQQATLSSHHGLDAFGHLVEIVAEFDKFVLAAARRFSDPGCQVSVRQFPGRGPQLLQGSGQITGQAIADQSGRQKHGQDAKHLGLDVGIQNAQGSQDR